MKNQHTKLLAILILLLSLLSVSIFTACGKTENIQSLRDKAGVTAQFTSNYNNEKIELTEPSTQIINIQFEQNMIYNFSCVFIYNYDKTVAKEEIVSPDYARPGTYYFTATINVLGQELEYKLQINLNHTKLTPTILLMFDGKEVLDTQTAQFYTNNNFICDVTVKYNQTTIHTATQNVQVEGLDDAYAAKKPGRYIVNYIITGYGNVDEDFMYEKTSRKITLEVLEPSQNIVLENNRDILSNTYYGFDIAHNGDFNITLNSANITSYFVTVYNQNLETVFSELLIKQQTEATKKIFFTKGKYYFSIAETEVKQGISAKIAFYPPTTNGKNINVTNTTEYNIVKFAPVVSGSYSFNNDALVMVYNQSGELYSDDYFESGKQYYFKVSCPNNIRLQLSLIADLDLLVNKQSSFTKTHATTTAKFDVSISEYYVIEGAQNAKVYDSAFGEVNFKDVDKKYWLNSNNTYFIIFENANIDKIGIKFYPRALEITMPGVSHSLVYDGANYFTVKVDETADYSIITQGNNSDAKIILYDYNLNKLSSSVKTFEYNFDSTKTYYLCIEITCDTSVTFIKKIT